MRQSGPSPSHRWSNARVFFVRDRGQPEKNPNCVLEDMREHQQRLAVRRLTVQFLSHKTSSRSSWIIHLASTVSCSPTRVQRAFRNGVCEHLTQSMGCPERLHKPSVSRERPHAKLTMLHVFQKSISAAKLCVSQAARCLSMAASVNDYGAACKAAADASASASSPPSER